LTKFFLSLLLLNLQLALGQNVDSISKIIITYGKSHSSWGNPGIYAKSEVIEFSKTSTSNFIISRYSIITSSAGDDGKTFRKDTTELSTKTSKIIPKEKIQTWLMQLNTNKENFTVSFIRPKLTKPTTNEIYQIAKKYKILWKLHDIDFDREDKADARKAIKEMKQFSGLESFLLFKRPSIEEDLVVIDSYNGLRIRMFINTDTIEYRCQFFEPLGQPITRFDKGNYTKGSKVFNLEANTYALKILPKNSMASKILDLNNIKEQYFKWYLEKRM